jgi:uncharacterized membrane protein
VIGVLRRFWRALVETLRRDFVAGLLVFVPVGFTILGVLWIVRQLDNLVLPQIFRFLGLEGRQPPLVGLVVTFMVILLAGALTRSFIGRTALTFWEGVVDRIPIARSLYTVLKQFMEAVFGTGSGQPQFNRVVLIEYPRKGIHSYAFVTGRVSQPPEELSGPLVKVFVPSTPNPTTGYFLIVPEADTIETGLGVEEAFKLIISAGIATGDGDTTIPLVRRSRGGRAALADPEPDPHP